MKKVSAVRQAFQKQLARIKGIIRRAEKRGYRFESDIIPQTPKRVTKASVRRLQEIKPITLYKKATYLTDEGKIVKGTEGRKIERSISAKKAQETRKRKAQQRIQEKQYPSIVDLVLQNIEDMIDSVRRDHQKAGNRLRKLLDRQIQLYGREAVAKALAQSPQEAIEIAQVAINYNPGDVRSDTAIREMEMLITGEIPNIQEAKSLQEDILEDEYTDYGSY